MKRRQYLSAAAAAIGGGLAGCLDSDNRTDTTRPVDGESEPQTGVLSTAVSDQPNAIDDFERLVVTIEEIWVYPKKDGNEESDTEDSTGGDSTSDTEAGTDTEESGEETSTTEDDATPEDGESGGDREGDGDGERVVIDAGGAEADLVKLQGDAQAIINDAELPTGEYSQIKLRVGDDVDGVLTDGSEAEVVTPGNAPLQFKQDFEIRENTRTTFVADFAPHRRGNNGYIIRPVASEVEVSYEEIESETEETVTETSESTTTESDGSTTDS